MASLVQVLTVPYDSGWRDVRLGRGPAALLAALPPAGVTAYDPAGDPAGRAAAGVSAVVAALLS